LRIH